MRRYSPCDNINLRPSRSNPLIEQTDPQPTVEESPPPRRGLRRRVVRSDTNRIISGLAGGIGEQLGVSPIYVRAGFIVAAFAGGAGIAAYLIGWALTLDQDEPAPPPAPPATSRQLVALSLIYLGGLLFLRALGLWFGDNIVWPIALFTFGGAIMWDRTDQEGRNRLTQLTRAEDSNRARLVVGALLMLAGMASLLGSTAAFSDLGPALFAVLLTAGGFMLAFGPWVWRMMNDLSEERRSRIRTEERAEMAAHLHDSVLQTLALIQRTDDQKRMVTLARGQERELRQWLYGDPDQGDEQLAGAVRTAAQRVEEAHDVPIDVVIVGDCPVDDDLRALVQATGEAMTNAAKHSGADKVSVYVEVDDATVAAWVSDQGSGFDVGAVGGDGRGIVESIIARMQRHGGTVDIVSEPAEGTEVHLQLERSTA